MGEKLFDATFELFIQTCIESLPDEEYDRWIRGDKAFKQMKLATWRKIWYRTDIDPFVYAAQERRERNAS